LSKVEVKYRPAIDDLEELQLEVCDDSTYNVPENIIQYEASKMFFRVVLCTKINQLHSFSS